MDAPLSSPTQTQHPGFQRSYFAHSSTSSTQSNSSSGGPASTQTKTQQSAPQQAQQQPQKRTAPTDNTSNFLQDFSLVAEAAKRAQMAVLMRDMEAVGI